MSKYTTEVRYICESKAEREDSAGAASVDSILDSSWNKIFTTNCEFFDNNYRSVLCKKILKHYYLREISAETAGIWILWMNTKLEEIMPYYNQLYNSALLQFDPFNDVNYTRDHMGEAAGTRNTSGSSESESNKTASASDQDNSTRSTNNSYTDTGNTTNNRHIVNDGTVDDSSTAQGSKNTTADSTASSSGDKGDRYSDTPQGTIANTDITGDAYLTNVRLLNESTSGTSHDATTENDLNTAVTNSVKHDNTTDRNTEVKNNIGTNNTSETAEAAKSSTSSESDISNATNQINEVSSNTDTYIEHVFGKMATTPYSDLLQKFRETFLNIDMLVIDEFSELFLQLW